MSKLIKRLAAVCLVVTTMIGTQSAHAVSANTTVEVNFPTILILYHFDVINLTVSQADLALALGGLTAGSCAGAAAGEYCVEVTPGPTGIALDLTGAAVDAGMSSDAPSLPAALASVNVDIGNAWGVRSIGPFGTGLTASVTGPVSGNLDDGNGELIPLSGVDTNDTSPAAGPGMATGDIVFTMDLSGLETSGTYSGVFTITVTSL